MHVRDEAQTEASTTPGSTPGCNKTVEESGPLGGAENESLIIAKVCDDLAQIRRMVDDLAHRDGPPTGRLWTRQDVAAYLQASLRFVDSLIADRALVPIKLGSLVRFDPAAVKAALKESARGRRGRG